MVEIIATVVGVVLTALVALTVYAYSNKISFALTSITTYVRREKEALLLDASERRYDELQAERLTITNYGFRKLHNVELHLPLRDAPFSIEVGEPKYLSKNAIGTQWEHGTLKFVVPIFPRNEKLVFNIFSVGLPNGTLRELKGTGGQYRIVEDAKFQLKRSLVRDVIWFSLFLFFVTVASHQN